MPICILCGILSITLTQKKAKNWWYQLNQIGSAAIFHVDLSEDRKEEALEWLDQAERDAYGRFWHEHSKREFSLCRAALRAILCQQLDCSNQQLAFQSGEYGKPFALLNGSSVPIEFNVSHSGRHGLIAWSPRERVGVDVEEWDTPRNIEDTLQTVFTSLERDELARSRGKRKRKLFFNLWVMKEALVKALGLGMAQDFSHFELPPSIYKDGDTSGIVSLPHQPQTRWQLHNLGNSQFAAAFALELNP